MNILETVIKKKKEFEEFMNRLDIKDFEQFSRTELTQFQEELRSVKERYLSLEINQLITDKKESEFPELLGVHHYPDLKKITFLNEVQLVELDTHLSRSRVGNYLNLSPVKSISYQQYQEVEQALTELQIVESVTRLKSPCCGEGISSPFALNKKEQWLEDLKKSNEEFESIGLIDNDEYRYFGYCHDCDTEYHLGDLPTNFFDNMNWEVMYKIAKARDTRLDNV